MRARHSRRQGGARRSRRVIARRCFARVPRRGRGAAAAGSLRHGHSRHTALDRRPAREEAARSREGRRHQRRR
eukprot:scaffold92113_cov33-Tisochrysis_lutea.AAC.5